MTVLANLNPKGLQLGDLSSLAHLKGDTLEGQLKLFLVTCQVENLSPRSVEDYGQKIGAFVDFCTGTLNLQRPSEVTPNHIRLFLLGMQQRCKPVSVHGYYGCVCRFFNWLVQEGTLKASPMAKMRPPKVPRHIIQPFKPEHIARLLTVCDSDAKTRSGFLGWRNRAIILTFLDTGLRLSELANIQLRDIDFDRETVKVMGKGSKERIVRISKATQKAILMYWRARDDDLPHLWLTEERKPLQARGVQQMIERIGKRAGVTNIRCSAHTFRHSFAIMALQNGMGEFSLQWLLGHSTLTQTRRYCGSLGANEAMAAHIKASPVERLRL